MVRRRLTARLSEIPHSANDRRTSTRRTYNQFLEKLQALSSSVYKHVGSLVNKTYIRVGSLVNKTYIRVGSLVNKTYDQFLEKLPAAVSNAALLGGGTMITGVALYGFTWVYHRRYNMTNSVKKRFLKPNPPPLIREGEHFPREKEEKETQKAFLDGQI